MRDLESNLNEWLRALLALPPQLSDTARSIDYLHYFVITITMIGSTAVGIVAVWFCVRYRRRGPVHPTPRVRASLGLEMTFIGGLLTLFIMWWVIGYRQYVAFHDTPESSHEVYVTAKQWMWKFSHPQGRDTVGVLVVPESQPVRLLLTSRDVIHSFYVPALRVKQDVVPGTYTTMWFEADREGTYTAFCAEYCGVNHSMMWADLVVLNPADYERWLEGAEPEPVATALANARKREGRVGGEEVEPLAARGRRVAASNGCLACHTVTGEPHIGPTWNGLFGAVIPLQEGGSVIADEAYLTESMMNPLAKLHEGYDPVMPAYRGVLEQPEVGALVAYIKSLQTVAEPLPVDLPEVSPLERGKPRPAVPLPQQAGARDGGAPSQPPAPNRGTR